MKCYISISEEGHSHVFIRYCQSLLDSRSVHAPLVSHFTCSMSLLEVSVRVWEEVQYLVVDSCSPCDRAQDFPSLSFASDVYVFVSE